MPRLRLPEYGVTELPYRTVVTVAQTSLHDHQIRWGVKWECARLLPRHNWEQISPVVSRLLGPHCKVGPELLSIIRDVCPTTSTSIEPRSLAGCLDHEPSALSLWRELDREDQAWAAGSDEGIGLKADDRWYGGKVQFLASLDISGDASGFAISLERPVVGKSTAFGKSTRHLETSADAVA